MSLRTFPRRRRPSAHDQLQAQLYGHRILARWAALNGRTYGIWVARADQFVLLDQDHVVR